MKFFCCFHADRENKQDITPLVPGAFAAQSRNRVPASALQNEQRPGTLNDDLLAAEEQATLGPLLQPQPPVQSSHEVAGAASAATDLSSVPTIQSREVDTTLVSAARPGQAGLEEPAATHPPNTISVNNIPIDTAADTSYRVEEWLSFSLSETNRSPVSSTHSDHKPLPPTDPDRVESCDLPAAETLPLTKQHLGSANPEVHEPGPIQEPWPPVPVMSASLAADARPKYRNRTHSEVSAVPDEVLSSVQQTAGVFALAHRRHSTTSAISRGLFTITAPPTLGSQAPAVASPTAHNCTSSGHIHASHLSAQVPQGENAPEHSTLRPAETSHTAPLDSPTRGTHIGAPGNSSGRSSPHSAAAAQQVDSPALRSTQKASTPSRIVLDGVLSMLHNRSSEPYASKLSAAVPDALSEALASLSMPLEQPRRGPAQRSLSHGSSPFLAARQNANAMDLRRHHSMHVLSSQRVGVPIPSTSPEQPLSPRNRGVMQTSANTASTASSPQPSAGTSPPLIVPSGLPGGIATKMRVTKMFFDSDREAVHGAQQDTVYETQGSTDAEVSRSSGFMVPSLGVWEQLETDNLSCSSGLSLVTPLQYHTGIRSCSYLGAPKPSAEEKRMQQMCQINVLGSAPEERYDRITSLVAKVFAMPVVLVSLVDKDRQWFKSVVGLPGVTETSREESFCAWTLLPQEPECLVVSDARNDARFRSNGLVTGPPYIQFYAGCPLVSSSGQRLGSLCVIDMFTRFFTSEDCNLLCNFSELVVRELEVDSAQEQRMFDAKASAPESLRPSEAWDVGLLVLHVEDKSWRIQHANARTGEILGVVDLSSFIGTDFWDFFSLKQPPADVHPSIHFRLQLLQGQDMSFDTRVFTDEGQKLWMTCTMRSGTQSQVDDHCPLVSVPMDLVPEPGTKAGYWFVSIRPMTHTMSKFARPAVKNVCTSHSIHDCNVHLFDHSALRGILLLTQISALPRSQLYSSMHALEREQSMDADYISTTGEWTIAEVIMTDDPYKLEAAMHEVSAQWVAAGIVNGVHACTNFCRSEVGQGALLLLRSVPHPINLSLRSAVHEGVFKRVPTPDELHNGVVTVDVPLALEAALHIARSLELLHASSLVHGNLSGASVVVSMLRHRSTPEERFTIGEDLTVGFATLGVPDGDVTVATPCAPSPYTSGALPGGLSVGFSQGGSLMSASQDIGQRGAATPHASGAIDEQLEVLMPVCLDDLAATCSDLQLFYAPERFDRFGQLQHATDPAADVWSLGMLLIYMLRLSLPLFKDGPLTLLQKARNGTLLNDVLQISEASFPAEVGTLISLCLSSNRLLRPSAARCAAALEHIKANLAEETGPLPETSVSDAL